MVIIPAFLHQKDLLPFCWVIVYHGKGNTKTFWGLLNTGSKIALILGYMKQHHVSPV